MLSKLLTLVVEGSVQDQISDDFKVEVEDYGTSMEIYVTVPDSLVDDVDELTIYDAISQKTELTNVEVNITIQGETERQDALEGAIAAIAGDDDEQEDEDDDEEFSEVDSNREEDSEYDDDEDDLFESEDIEDEYLKGALDNYSPTFQDVEDFFERDDV